MIDIIHTDTVFYNSPSTGDADCICSRCGERIEEYESAIRAWPTEPGDFGYDRDAPQGTELRYHIECLGLRSACVDPFSSTMPSYEDDDEQIFFDNDETPIL